MGCIIGKVGSHLRRVCPVWGGIVEAYRVVECGISLTVGCRDSFRF